MINLDIHFENIAKLQYKHPYKSKYVCLGTYIIGKKFDRKLIDLLFLNSKLELEIYYESTNEMLEHLYRLNSVEKKEFDRRRDR